MLFILSYCGHEQWAAISESEDISAFHLHLNKGIIFRQTFIVVSCSTISPLPLCYGGNCPLKMTS